MHKYLLAVAAATLLAGCGGSGSSTGPTTPHKNYVVTVTNAGFTPDTVNVGVQDTVTWNDTEGNHSVTFYGSLPANAIPSSGNLGPGSHAFTVFVQSGTFNYKDDSSSATGVVVVK